MGNYSEDPIAALNDAIAKGYARVRFQQGKPLLDRELNLLGDLTSPQRLIEHHFGNGVPADSDGFLIGKVVSNDFPIQAGRCLVGGYEVLLAADTTYKNQPQKANILPTLPAGASNVYLRVFTSEVDGAGDPKLLNNGDVKSETAIREKIVWEVLVSTAAINTSDHFLLAVITLPVGSTQDRRRTGMTVGPLRDEIVTARGDASQLGQRLDASLTANGALKNNSVGNAQIADNSVNLGKIADNSVGLSKIIDGAVTQPKIANNSISIAQLKKTSTLTTNATVGAGTELDVVLSTSSLAQQTFFLTSAIIIAPAPALNTSLNIAWNSFYRQTNSGNVMSFSRGVSIRNKSTVTVTVQVQLFELLPG